jgi:TPR repeat protein
VTRNLDPGEIDALIQRGEAFILQGDFAAARLMLQRAAEAGSDRAALTLGATYDPLMLRKVGVVGFKAEPALAREWYERAAALGSPEASSRLAELGRK